MATCFVIQPFDNGPFDKRYQDVLDPAIRAAGLEPYRVDHDPAASIPIDQIESGIRASSICLADISTDNPNVWFELGFAIAAQREVVILCSASRRDRFPFDVQHRNVITYTTESSSDFVELKDKITKRLKAILAKGSRIEAAASISPIADVEGLAQHEVVALVSVAQNLDHPGDIVSTYTIRQDMEKAGFTKVAVTLGLSSLLKKQLLESQEVYDERGEGPYVRYSVTEKGMSWLQSNHAKLILNEVREEDVPF